ncbi:unnamed protein product [Cunninghamella blakesleeana]
MKREIDLIEKSTSSTCRIIRVPYLTPYKIALLYLISGFCKSKLPEITNSQLCKYLVDKTLKTYETNEEPNLQEFLKSIQLFVENAIEADSLIKRIHLSLLRITCPDDLHQFIADLTHILEEREMGASSHTILHGTSVFGLFVRRCRIEYLRSTYKQTTELFDIYRAYVTECADDRQLNHILQENRDHYQKHHQHGNYDSKKKGHSLFLEDHLQLGGWISDHQIDNFLSQQAELIEKTGTSDIPPSILDRYLNFLQKHAPDLGKIHQVRFLNYIRTAEYEGAVSNLHRFFDCCLLYQEVQMYHYALLNLGILEAKFNHTSQSLSALEECLIVAREYQDEECLNEVQSWIHYVRTTLGNNQEPSSSLNIINDTKNKENSVYLQSIYKLCQVRDLLKCGDSPSELFETLFQCIIEASFNGIEYITLPYNMVKSVVWKKYGNIALSKTYMDIALNENGTVDDKEKIYILAANMSYHMGDYLSAKDYLESFATKYPERLLLSLDWKQTYSKVLHHLPALGNIQYTLDNQINNMNFLKTKDPLKYFEALHNRAEKLYNQKDFGSALVLLESNYEKLRNTNFHTLIVKNYILRSQIYMYKDDIETAVILLQYSLSICKKSHDAVDYYRASIKLANCYMKLPNEIEKASYILENIMPKVMVLGCKELETELVNTYNELQE